MFHGLFGLLFPEDCRVCNLPLTEISRIPVCAKCLSAPEPLDAEFFCAACRTPFANAFPLDRDGLCALCRQGLHGFDAAYSYGFYEGPLRELVMLLKYGRIWTLASPLGAMLSRALPRDHHFDVIVAMPMHWRRRWQRGFNQADLLAREISRRTGVPLASSVRRMRATPPQAGLTSAMRRANMVGAFAVRRPEHIQGRRILLIDDVLTTGSTAGACARVLKSAGAVKVTVLTLARADRRSLVDAAAPPVSKLVFQTPGSLPDGQSGSIA